jgi:hypothetical protein
LWRCGESVVLGCPPLIEGYLCSVRAGKPRQARRAMLQSLRPVS